MGRYTLPGRICHELRFFLCSLWLKHAAGMPCLFRIHSVIACPPLLSHHHASSDQFTTLLGDQNLCEWGISLSVTCLFFFLLVQTVLLSSSLSIVLRLVLSIVT